MTSVHFRLGQQACGVLDVMHPSLHSMHQTERNQKAKGLGTEESGTSGILTDWLVMSTYSCL